MNQKLFDLSGRVAIVTGGNGGIGLGMALGMARAGATIVVAGRDATKNAAAVKEIQAAGAKASAIPVDVLKEESCRTLIGETVKMYGRLDILVNNAGINIRKQPEQYTLAEWHRRKPSSGGHAHRPCCRSQSAPVARRRREPALKWQATDRRCFAVQESQAPTRSLAGI